MLVSLQWLNQYVDIKDKSIDELENALTMIGQEVEAIEEKGKFLDNVVVGQVVEYGRHPEADKLSLCKVDVGEEVLQIVCGAPNHKEGDKVAVAKIGAVLGGDFKIKKAKIRGIESRGMMCSEVELGIGQESDGIIILSEDAPIGEELRKYMEIADVVFELEITPNRPDCLSHIGIARELAAYYGQTVKYPQINLKEVVEKVEDNISVEIEAKDLCHRYCARIVKGVDIKESPKWLKNRLQSVGIRAINNIVDITNYLLMEYGHPLHAFDLDKLESDKIVVRKAKNGEKIVTLDDIERELNDEELLICDNNKPIALAGIMGGANTEVDKNTKNILIEVAHFTPENIRLSSKRLGLASDSSYRFERGIDIEDSYTVINRAAELMTSLGGGEVLSGIADQYIEKYESKPVSMSFTRLNSFVGKEIPKEKVTSILEGLELKVEKQGEDSILIYPTTFRTDIVCEADIFEEVIRMYGFENIEPKMPEESIQSGSTSDALLKVKSLKYLLKEIGLQEVINYSFLPKDSMDKIKWSKENLLEIINPINEDMSVMRKTLIYSLLATVRDNFNRNIYDLNIFEVSKVFEKTEEKHPLEEMRVAFAIAGKKDKFLWEPKPRSYDFYDIKSYVEDLFDGIGFVPSHIERSTQATFHPGRAADVFVGKDYIGTFGEIHPDVVENMGISKEKVYIAEFDINKIFKYAKDKRKYKKIAKYPAIQRDLAIVLADNVLIGDMIKDINKAGNLIEKVELFDIYKGEQLGNDKKSVAISITFRDQKKTLKDEEINKLMEKILGIVEKKYNGELRK